MKLTLFNNPQNLWGKWVLLSPFKQNSILLMLLALFLYSPLKHHMQLQQTHSSLELEIHQQQAKLTHQQQILGALKRKSEQALLTPQLAAKLPPINQQIQQLATDIVLNDSQWTFEQTPRLKLQVQGYFMKLTQFLTALLTQTPELLVTHLEITRSEQDADFSIQSEISLQLQIIKEP